MGLRRLCTHLTVIRQVEIFAQREVHQIQAFMLDCHRIHQQFLKVSVCQEFSNTALLLLLVNQPSVSDNMVLATSQMI